MRATLSLLIRRCYPAGCGAGAGPSVRAAESPHTGGGNRLAAMESSPLNMSERRPTPASSGMRGPWISISYVAVGGYLLYGIGSATPYLRADLHLTDFEAGLHASALAVGVLAAGFSADAIARVIRPGGLFDLAVASIVAGLLF